jgi:hypothetical protein
VKKSEAIFWRDLLRSEKALNRKQRDELAGILHDLFIAKRTGGRPYKSTLERVHGDFSTAVMNEYLEQGVAAGRSLEDVAADLAKDFNPKLKEQGRKQITAGAVLKRVERWKKNRQ